MSQINYPMEFLKCKLNPLYFIEKYVTIPTQAGPQLISEAGLWNKTNKYKLAVKVAWKFKRYILLFPRQTGKTTLQAALMLHVLNFYPSIQAGYLSIDKNRVQDYVRRLASMYSALPKFLQTPRKRALSDRVTYFKLENGSYLHTSSTSGNISESEVFRGLSLSNIQIDEAAFYNLNELMTSVGPAYSRASLEAKKANKPHIFGLTTTPNGINDGGFYETMVNAVPVEELLLNPDDPMCTDLKPDEECYKILNAPGKNGYVLVKLNWNEVYDENWYKEQERILNFNRRRIAQEIELVFLGSSNSIFSDETIMKLIPVTKVWKKNLFNNISIDLLTDNLDPNSVYTIGCDVAASSEDAENADYSAMVIWDATNNVQIGEMKTRTPVLKHYGYAIMELIKFMINVAKIPEENIKLVIERNSFGLGLIEFLIYDEEMGDLFQRILFKSQIRKEEVFGVQVTAANRPLIINTLIQQVNEHPESIKGRNLIEELRALEQKSNGRIEAARGMHDDLVFAAAHALHARKELIKRGELESKGENYGVKINLEDLIDDGLIAQDTPQKDNKIKVIYQEAGKKEYNVNKEIEKTIFNIL